MDAVTVEEHGAGAEARRVMRVGDVALTAFVGEGDPEPRAHGRDIAQLVEVSRPRDFKRMIAGHAANGVIAPRVNRALNERFTSDGKSRGFVESLDYWLSEPDALFVITQSGTPRAAAITKKIIDVFVAVRRGVALASVSLRAELAPIREELALMRAQLAASGARPDAGTIARAQADKLRAEFCDIAGLASGAQRRSKLWMRERSKADNAVRRAVKLPIGRAWDSLPAGLYADALARAKELRADAQRAADERRQPELFARRAG